MSQEATTLTEELSAMNWVMALSPLARERVLVDCSEERFKAREIVARKGDPSTSWIGVVEGLVKVTTITASGRGMMFAAVPEGSWVGEGSVIKREPRKYELMAVRDSRVVFVPRPTFMWLLETSFEFSRFVIDHLNERSGQFLSMLELSRVTDPVGRVAGSICSLFNSVIYPNASPLLNISQEEIAELAGLSRSTTNLAITKLKSLNLVLPEYGGLLVLDVDRLQRFFHQFCAEHEGRRGRRPRVKDPAD